jgi:hypothetical protein
VAGGRVARELALGAPVAGASSATLASWVTARRITSPGPREKRFVTPWELGISYEEVAFRTKDGLLLRGWWLIAHPYIREVSSVVIVRKSANVSCPFHPAGLSGNRNMPL